MICGTPGSGIFTVGASPLSDASAPPRRSSTDVMAATTSPFLCIVISWFEHRTTILHRGGLPMRLVIEGRFIAPKLWFIHAKVENSSTDAECAAEERFELLHGIV